VEKINNKHIIIIPLEGEFRVNKATQSTFAKDADHSEIVFSNVPGYEGKSYQMIDK
jgi:hypothetical protein